MSGATGKFSQGSGSFRQVCLEPRNLVGVFFQKNILEFTYKKAMDSDSTVAYIIPIDSNHIHVGHSFIMIQ